MIQCKTDTAVVILSYNGQDLHRMFLPRIIEESKGQYDIVLVDNASTDDTLTFIQKSYPEVNIIHHERNLGFAGGYHKALEKISAKYYILLSADFEVSGNWFSPLHQLMEKHPDIGAIQPKIKYQKKKEMFEYAGAAGGFMDKYGYMFCRGRMFFDMEEDHGQYDDNIEVFWASGGCLFVRAGLYHKLGGLDKDMFAHMEEIDLCWRMKNAGFRIAFCGNSEVYHVGGSVISYGSPQKLFYNYRNSLILIHKNERASKVWWLIPFRIIMDGISGFRHLVKGEIKEVLVIIQAHWNYFLQFRSVIRKRRTLRQYVVPNRNTNGIYSHSIVWKYFIGGIKKFSELNTKDLTKRI